MPNFKKNTSPAMKRSGFKMKSSPAKNLGNFFGSIFSSKAVKGTGEQLQKGQKERGVFSETAKAEKKEMRKTGESKFQYDVRKKREGKRAERTETKRRKNDPLLEEIKDTSELQGPKNKPNTKATKAKKATKSKLSGSGTDARKKQYDAKGWKYDDTIKGYNRDGSRKEKKNKYDDLFDVPFNPNLKYDQYDSEGNPITKKSPYKKGIGSYTKKAKGSRGYKMKRK